MALPIEFDMPGRRVRFRKTKAGKLFQEGCATVKFASKVAKVRSHVSHPIIDADGHLVELGPVLDDELLSYLEEAGGRGLRDRYLAGAAKPFDTSTALANRDHPAVREKWLAMPSW